MIAARAFRVVALTAIWAVGACERADISAPLNAKTSTPVASLVQRNPDGNERDLKQLRLNADTRWEDVVAIWGPSDEGIPLSYKRELHYLLQDGARLILWFDYLPPLGLVNATLVDQHSFTIFEARPDELCKDREVACERREHSTSPYCRGRKIEDVQFSSGLTEELLLDTWGPPDTHIGSGVDYWVYDLRDCSFVTVLFDHPLPAHLANAQHCTVNALREENCTTLYSAR